MPTKDLKETQETRAKLSDHARLSTLALSVVIERIASLPKTDRDELFELFQELRSATDDEELLSIQRAMEEVLAQIPAGTRPLAQPNDGAMPQGVQKWAGHVGRRIRELREKAQLTQVELSDRAGLPQSHISRLENAEHSPTNMTLKKIAAALGVEVGEIDPCAD
jgi:DNA-binding XRE family transcriptional regulator